MTPQRFAKAIVSIAQKYGLKLDAEEAWLKLDALKKVKELKGGKCNEAKGWYGLKGACKRGKKGEGESKRKESKLAIAGKIKDRKSKEKKPPMTQSITEKVKPDAQQNRNELGIKPNSLNYESQIKGLNISEIDKENRIATYKSLDDSAGDRYFKQALLSDRMANNGSALSRLDEMKTALAKPLPKASKDLKKVLQRLGEGFSQTLTEGPGHPAHEASSHYLLETYSKLTPAGKTYLAQSIRPSGSFAKMASSDHRITDMLKDLKSRYQRSGDMPI